MTAPGDQLTARGWTPDDSNFGARLALVRQRMAWGNVKEAATECGLPTESWRTWERDGVEPRKLVEIARVISQRTGCDHTWLVMGSVHSVPDASRAARPPAIAHYVAPPTRTTDQRSRPRDNRPTGHPSHHSATGARRTAHLPRNTKPKGA